MPHPALKAISEQAIPADEWMNDDDHRYGALRESYAFEYAVYEQADKNKNTHFDFDVYDGYESGSRPSRVRGWAATQTGRYPSVCRVRKKEQHR